MKKRLNGGYGAVFSTYWIIYAVISSFASVFLLEKGYDNSHIGMTLAAASILAVIMQPVAADFADRSVRLGAIGVTEIMTVCMMFFTVGMFVFSGGTLALCLVFVLLIGFHTALQPLFNSMAFSLEKTGVRVSFGMARAAGSLAYAFFVAIFGTLVEHHGVGIMPMSAEVSCLCLLASLVFTGCSFRRAMKDKPAATAEELSAGSESAETDAEITLVQFIRENRTFFIMNLGVIGLYFSNAVLNFYMAQIVDGTGGTTEDMGRILAVMAFLEIPTMVFFRKLKERFSCRFLLKAACVGFTVKIFICWIAGSVTVLYAAQLLQPFAFALFLPGMVHFTDEIMRPGEAVKGQALYTTMITAATVFASLIGGVILDAAGPGTLLLVSTIVTAAGAALIMLIIDKVK